MGMLLDGTNPPFVMAFLPIMPATMTDKQLMADRSQSAEK
jgi:hypothetical protein